MPCLLALLAVFFPRVVIVLLVIFSDWLGRAFENQLWPLAGFLLMPFTTLAYAVAINMEGAVEGIYLVLVVVAALMDTGAWSGGSLSRRS
jgi:CDP-diglyceride synthetase